MSSERDATQPIRVLIVHPDETAYQEMEQLPERQGMPTQIVGRAVSEMSALRAVEELAPDIVLIEVDQDRFDAFALAETLNAEDLDSCIVFIGDRADPQNLRRALTCGAQEYLIQPVELAAVADAFADVVSRHRQRRRAAQPKGEPERVRPACEVIGLISARGGPGKSVLASNLSIALRQETEEPVSLIDYGYADSCLMLNVAPKRGLVDLTSVLTEIDERILQDLRVSHPSGLSVYSAHTKVGYVNVAPVIPESLRATLAVLRRTERFVVIDFPPWPPGSDLGLLSELTTVLVVATGWNLYELRDTKALIDASGNGLLTDEAQLRVVLNRCDKRDLIRLADIEENLGQRVYAEIPNNSRLVLNAVNLGQPLVIDEPDTEVAVAIRDLARKLLGKEALPQQKRKIRRPLFRL